MITFLFKSCYEEETICAYIDTFTLRVAPCCPEIRFFNSEYHSINVDFEHEDIKTILTKEELKVLLNYDGQDLTEILYKLESEENEKLFAEVFEEEKQDIMRKYHLSNEDVLEIFDAYPCVYRDKSVVVEVYSNKYDLGRHIAWVNGVFDCGQDEDDDFRYDLYLDFEKYGRDLVRKNDCYIELGNGKIAYVNIPRIKL